MKFAPPAPKTGLTPTTAANLRAFNLRDLGSLEFESGTGAAEVAVIVPLFNYERTITECIASVAAQDLDPLSLIIIDDASTDDGGMAAIAALNDHNGRFATARIVRHHRNQGLSMARNSGIEWSAEPYVFMLDADNRIRRSCLATLLEALKTSGAAFSYPQLRMFGDIDSIGLADVWEPKRLSEGNYIDAMALLRRAALMAAGGYVSLANEYGWEDYDLWCRFAELGFEGVFVPEILGEYRVHKSSMLRTITNNSTKELMSEIMIRHPTIFDTMGDQPDSTEKPV